MAYKVTMIFSDYVYIDGEYKRAEAKKSGKCATWDDLDTLLASQVEAFGSVKCEIQEVDD